VGSEYWLDTLFEQSWAYFMAGDYPRALGNIHTIQSPYFPRSFYPEADIVRSVIYFTTCQYDDATTLVARFRTVGFAVRRLLRLAVEAHPLHRQLLQGGVGLEFLLNHGPQVERRDLQDLEGVPQLRRQHQ